MFTPEIKTILAVFCGPPTDLPKLSERLGVVEVEWRELNVDGMVLPKAGGYKVILNSNRTRSRFSWAHELGHVIVQAGALASPQFRGRPASHRQIEKLCDKIAAEILMPEELFRQQMAKTGFAFTSVPALARTFDTSIESTAIRFADFLPVPAVLSKWKPASGQPLSLTHGWSRPNEKCRPYKFGIPRGNKARHVEANGPDLAFKSAGVVRTKEPLFVTRRSKRGDDYKWATFPTESMAFGSGDYRYVLSLSKVGKDSFTPLALEA